MSDLTLTALKNQEEYLWINPNKKKAYYISNALTLEGIHEADQRLKRFGPFFKAAFTDLVNKEGLIESPLSPLETFKTGIVPFLGGRILGHWFLKRDDLLPISGSVKARGGVYEIIKWAETLAIENKLIAPSSDYSCFLTESFQKFFSQFTVYVGSTGNLGLSIGTISRALGFKVKVHMSSDAKAWKIEKLKSIGAEVILHESDYSAAVAKGRAEAAKDPKAYFVDDENSMDLFTGYATAALRLKAQLEEKNLFISAESPLFVYLPCGVGGAPGGIAYALKALFGQNVYLFFAEPTKAPCMLYGLHTGQHEKCHIKTLGIDGLTVADGLAVGSPSGLVCNLMTPLLDGIYTVNDEKLLWLLNLLHISENIYVEPSATASLMGPMKLFYTEMGFKILLENGLLEKMENAVHVSWATGGSLVPLEQQRMDIKKGKEMTLDSL